MTSRFLKNILFRKFARFSGETSHFRDIEMFSGGDVTIEMYHTNYCKFGRLKRAIFRELEMCHFWEIEICHFRGIETSHIQEIEMCDFWEIKRLQFSGD